MKKVVVPIVERDYNATQGRLSYLSKAIAEDYSVEILTPSQNIEEDIKEKIGDCQNVSLRTAALKFLPLPFRYRDDLARIFIQYTDALSVPNTDLKIWEIAAFDDFWGHISNCAYPELTEVSADFVLIPLMSHDDHPMEDADVFYTSVAFRAKEAGAKIVGYQLYPVFSSLKLMPRLMDAIIVKEEYERQFYVQGGIAAENIHLLTDVKDIYSLSTIEDAYKNNIYNSQIKIPDDELSISVCNHEKLRPQLKEIFNVLGKVGIPLALSLLKREFTVRELSEDQIIEDLYFGDIKKFAARFYLVEHQSLAPMIMLSDVIISPSYITPLEFAARYGKKAIVFDPLGGKAPSVDGVTFVHTQDELAFLLKKAYEDKKNAVGVAEILDRI